MARLVKKEDKFPFEIKVGEESMWMCMCGLSNNQPFCDDSHKIVADEDNRTYAYDKERKRTEVRDWDVLV
jgi:CDGSH iron-sulfur domain-containing protein 3